jgi:hypothetical protein
MLTEVFHSIPQYLQVNCDVILSIRPLPFPPVDQSLIKLAFDGYELFTSLNES